MSVFFLFSLEVVGYLLPAIVVTSVVIGFQSIVLHINWYNLQ